MPARLPITVIAFDMFGTLVLNETDQWRPTFAEIVTEQRLPISGPELYKEWGAREINFRKVRTNMRDPASSPPFRTYHDAWRQAFEETFQALGVSGDAAGASSRCIEALSKRTAFPHTHQTLERLASHYPLAVLSNADDDFLLPVIAFNGWASKQNGWRFQTVVSSESAGAYKPDPRIFADFCRQTSVQPQHVLYVGDSPYDDVHGAKLAGMHTVLIRRDQRNPGRTPPPEKETLLQADFEIDALQELEGILLPGKTGE